MEMNPADTILGVENDTKDQDPIPDQNCIKKAPDCAGQKKKRGAVQLLKAASFLLRRPKKTKSFPTSSHDHRNQVQEARSSMSSSPMAPEQSDQDVRSPVSRSGYSSSSCSEVSASRYASAVNLQELDRIEDNDDGDDEAYADCGGDEMIDSKADEFIAQFYEQIRLQRMNSVDRRYHDMNQRSIG